MTFLYDELTAHALIKQDNTQFRKLKREQQNIIFHEHQQDISMTGMDAK